MTGDLFAWLCVAGLVVAIGVTTLAPLQVGHAITGRAIAPHGAVAPGSE